MRSALLFRAPKVGMTFALIKKFIYVKQAFIYFLNFNFSQYCLIQLLTMAGAIGRI